MTRGGEATVQASSANLASLTRSSCLQGACSRPEVSICCGAPARLATAGPLRSAAGPLTSMPWPSVTMHVRLLTPVALLSWQSNYDDNVSSLLCSLPTLATEGYEGANAIMVRLRASSAALGHVRKAGGSCSAGRMLRFKFCMRPMRCITRKGLTAAFGQGWP